MNARDIEEAFKHLDERCYSCRRSGKVSLSGHDCDVCYGTGYQCTGAGIELLNFLLRQRKRIQQTARERI